MKSKALHNMPAFIQSALKVMGGSTALDEQSVPRLTQTVSAQGAIRYSLNASNVLATEHHS